MIINLDLEKEFERFIFNEINNAKKMGFSFEDYNNWKKKEKLKIKENIKQLIKLKVDHKDNIDRLKEDNLKKAYERHLIYTYANLRERLIPQKPRKILYVNGFQRIPEYEEGLIFLEDKIKSGKDLLPHMSRNIFDTSSKDGLLYDFNIQHLHLGLKPSPKNPQLIEGRKKILYCVFDDENAYFLVIDNHGRWGDIELIRLIKNNFPHLIEPFEMNVQKLSNHFTEVQRVKLRKAGINTPIEVDGKCYMSPGWGVKRNRNVNKFCI